MMGAISASMRALLAAASAQPKSDWHPDFVTALYENANPDRRYTMDRMREYADAFHRSRVEANTPASDSDVRRKALEEASALCQAIANGFVSDVNPKYSLQSADGAKACADAIRALLREAGSR